MSDIRVTWYRPTKRYQRGELWLLPDFYAYVVVHQTFDGWVWSAENANGTTLAKCKRPLATRDNAENNFVSWAGKYREAHKQYARGNRQ